MDKFFGFINSLVGKKSFRIILGMALLFFLFKDNVKNNMRLLNVEKAKDVLTKVFKNKFKNKIDKLSKSDKSGKKTSVSDVVDEYGGEKTAKEVAVEDESKVVKKQLKPDSEIQKTQENEKKARQITNIFVKLRALEELYMQRNKDKLIDRSRVAKYGDFVYYSMKTVFDVAHEGADYPESHFFLQVAKNDVIGKKLVGKKVGQLVELEYSDFIATLPEQDRKALQENIDNMIKNTNDEYAKKGVKIFNSTKIKYNVRILVFYFGHQLE
ncbi:hypothetical protein FACS1894152_5800 [Bacilli bacterium]|nr:hypothetical protein FACS1894152_5800 [Bacilli bacterium]